MAAKHSPASNHTIQVPQSTAFTNIDKQQLQQPTSSLLPHSKPIASPAHPYMHRTTARHPSAFSPQYPTRNITKSTPGKDVLPKPPTFHHSLRGTYLNARLPHARGLHFLHQQQRHLRPLLRSQELPIPPPTRYHHRPILLPPSLVLRGIPDHRVRPRLPPGVSDELA